jgi:putative flippase GtrA
VSRASRLIERARGDSVDAQAARYLVVGAVTAAIYAILTVAFHAGLGAPIAAAIVAAYICAVSVHFVLQRRVVFAARGFVLSTRQQVGRYIGIGAVQLPLTFGGILVLNRWVGISQTVAYLLVSAAITASTFLFLRSRVFHGESASR